MKNFIRSLFVKKPTESVVAPKYRTWIVTYKRNNSGIVWQEHTETVSGIDGHVVLLTWLRQKQASYGDVIITFAIEI